MSAHASREEAVRETSNAIATELFRQTAPQLVETYEQIERRALPRGLRDVRLGAVDESIEAAAVVLRAIAQAIRARGDAIYGAGSVEAAAEIAQSAILSELVTSRSNSTSAALVEPLAEVLRRVLPQVAYGLDSLPIARDERARLRRCLVRIEDGPFISSGFAVSEDGCILTAEHVARDKTKLTIAFISEGSTGSAAEGEAAVVATDPSTDLAVLRAEGETWSRLRAAGLAPHLLSPEWKARDPVFCVGYQEQDLTPSPRTVGGHIHPWDSQLPVRFGDTASGSQILTQNCVVLSLSPLDAHVLPGMSGAPALNTRTGRVFGIVVGAQRQTWLRSDERHGEVWELAAPGYGFIAPISDSEQKWPRLAQLYA